MKNTLFFTREQKGFILPFVLFAVVIIMLVITSSIHIYQNNIRLTNHHIQQLKIESLFQSSLSLFKQHLENGDIPPIQSPYKELTKLYTLPDGNVNIIYQMAKGTDRPAYHLKCRIVIDGLSYSFNHYLYLHESGWE